MPALGDGQVDFEEFVTLLGPKLSTSGIPEKFHGTDFDTVFWKVCPGWFGFRLVHTVEGCIGPVNGQGHTVKGAGYPRLLYPPSRCLISQKKRSGSQSSRIWRPVTEPGWLQGTGWWQWWWQWPKHHVSSPSKCDMQKLTVDELKRLLYDTFCEHLSMKDIENIIMTEEESHLGTAEECPVDVESE